MDVGIYTESFTNSDLNPLHKGHKEGAKFHKVYILCVSFVAFVFLDFILTNNAP